MIVDMPKLKDFADKEKNDSKIENWHLEGQKTLWKMKNMQVTSIFSFCKKFSKGFLVGIIKIQPCLVIGLFTGKWGG